MKLIFSRQKLLDPLNELRGFACLLVIFYHISLLNIQVGQNGYGVQWMFFPNGQVGVWILFYLSGFLLGSSFVRNRYNLTFKSLIQYFFNRVKRIFPLYYLIVLIIFIKFSMVTKTSILTIGIPLLTFRAESLVNTFPVSYLWTISTQLKQYLLAPIIFSIFSYLQNKYKHTIYFVLLLTIVMSISLRLKYLSLYDLYNTSDLNLQIHQNWLLNSDVFFFGFGVSFMNKHNAMIRIVQQKAFIYLRNLILLILLVIMYLISSYGNENYYVNYWQYIYHYVLMPTIVMIVIGFYIVLSKIYTSSTSQTKIKLGIWHIPHIFLAFVGIISYEIYLIHYIVIYSTSLTLHCASICDLQLFSRNSIIVLGISIMFAIGIKYIESLLNKNT